MSVNLNPYLAFRDNAREAMEFYRSIFGGELTVNTFGEFDAAQMGLGADENDKVMHSQLTGGHGVTFMAADTPNTMQLNPGNQMSMSLFGDDHELLSGWYDRLAEGGSATMALNQAPWGDTFGVLVDRFGVQWMIDIAGPGGAGASAS